MRYKTTDRHIHVLYLQINDVFCSVFGFSSVAEVGRAESYGNVCVYPKVPTVDFCCKCDVDITCTVGKRVRVCVYIHTYTLRT